MKAIDLFSSISAAACADEAAENTAQDVVRYLCATGMLFPLPDLKTHKDMDAWTAEASKHKAPKEQIAEYRTARAMIAARKIGGASGVKSYTMDAETWTNLPEGPMKGYRVRALGAGRQALLDLRKRHYRMAEATFGAAAAIDAANKGQKAGKGAGHNEAKDLLATFEDFKKSATSRNQRSEEVGAGDLAVVIGKMRELLVAALPKK